MNSSPNFFVPHTWATMSIQDALASANPTLQVDPNPTRLVTANVADIANPRIAHWEDFDLHSLRQAYGDLMEQYPVPRVAMPRSPFECKRLIQLKRIFINHVFPRLVQPIKTGATVLEDRLGDGLPDVSMRSDTLVEWPYRSGLSLISDNEVHYLVSCVVLGTQWTSAMVENASSSGGEECLPLRRVAAYCVSTDTRYGFVLTPEEIVVVRVSGTAHDKTQPCLIEWKAVPWSASGPNTLTVTLSLWFIAMMSLNPAHRALRPPGAVPPVNLWWKYRDPAGTVTYQHHLSLRQVVRPLTGVIVQDAPSA
ncbi:uncharacterized protein B0J16DRAFT_268229 [Fusarium flagelliforme]|uniref:uncharacterized protein n=1 Tax=Fusarium flagelliforme TaxID=2675880 RepID=UPI001E8EB770|nr:uncharacterized protein B0J16DRAFT_268229 [Fusarium flagelliforme]KAH7184706.1 hypothetical protein B0J16DRAFT_268229 [Fusarium flagelliforme]